MIKKRTALIDRVTQSVCSPSPFGEGRGEASIIARVSATTVSEREQTRKNMGYRLGKPPPPPPAFVEGQNAEGRA